MRLAAIVLAVSATLTTRIALAQSASEPARVADEAARVVQSRCVPCHRPDGDAPFSLASLDDARRRASMIVQATRSGYMPPWKPVEGFGNFAGARRLTAAEIDTLDQWVRMGAPSGTSDREAPAVVSSSARDKGEPDLVISLPTYTLRADGPDVFRNFVVAIPSEAAGFVRGMQFRPRSRAVHHANIRVDATAASRRLDDADPEPGYEGIIARSADFPDGQFLGWTPGQLAPALSDELSWRIRGGSDLVVQLHLRPTGKTELIAPIVGFYLGDRGPARTPTMIRLGRQDLDIPAGASSHSVRDTFTLPVAVDLWAVQPHAHFRARSMEGWATLPDGSRRPLIRIDDWDVNWQDRYTYASPVHLPAGTTVSLDYTFDNSAANPKNPDRPLVRSRWGWRSTDEMADLWMQVIAATEPDRNRLAGDVARKMLTADAVGAEVLLEREPNHVHLRNDAAGIYLALGQPAAALRHFEAVRQLQPKSAPAWFNEAVALEASGRVLEAAEKYGEAVRIDPDYSPAHNNRGALLLRAGRVADARQAFERAVAGDAGNADAQANLGMAMIATGQPDAGLTHVNTALDLNPALLAGLTPHVWLLCAHADAAVRRPAQGRAIGERIRAADKGSDAGVLDALAACHAALGAFQEAVTLASAAESATASNATELRAAIRQRIALYRAAQPYYLPR